MLFLNESAESIEVSATANMSSIKMHEVLNAVWAVGFDMWFAFGLMMLLAAASCASHIPCWYASPIGVGIRLLHGQY